MVAGFNEAASTRTRKRSGSKKTKRSASCFNEAASTRTRKLEGERSDPSISPARFNEAASTRTRKPEFNFLLLIRHGALQ